MIWVRIFVVALAMWNRRPTAVAVIQGSMVASTHLRGPDGLVQLPVRQGDFASLRGFPVHRPQVVLETDSWKYGCRLDVLAPSEVCLRVSEGTRRPRTGTILLARSERPIAVPEAMASIVLHFILLIIIFSEE